MSEERTEEQYVQEARNQGWKPQEEYSGDPDKWSDAKTFVENGEKIAAIATKQKKSLESRVQFLEQTNQELSEFHKKSMEAQRKQNETLMRQLNAERAKAIEEGDGQRFTRAEQAIKQLEAQNSEKRSQTVGPTEAWQVEWASENDWYDPGPNHDVEAKALADGMLPIIARETGYKDKALLEFVRSAMPHKFKNPNRETSITDGKSVQVDSSKPAAKRSYEALPDEAKAACDKFVSQKLLTKEQYLADYPWE